MNKRKCSNLKNKRQLNSSYVLIRENGITLIALVITIIVMLILAGVSLNATIGENGIIAKAKNTTYAQSRATLEEYLQQYYVENYDEFADAENKAIALKNYRQSSSWFYQGAPLGYVVDSDGNSHYFINVSGLPDDIKQSVSGGTANGKENLTYADYANMKDVYGVTSNLKVYYCPNGKNTIEGISIAELDVADSTKEIFEAGSNMAKLITGSDEKNVTLEDTKSVKNLTINASSGISDLRDLYAMVSLQELTLSDIHINNLNGIENASQLYYVCFNNVTVDDYSSLTSLNNRLKHLYLSKTNDNEIEKLCSSIAKTDFINLNYFGIYDSTLNVTNIGPLNNLTTQTKENIKYLYLYNNYIDSVEALKGFKNILILLIYKNKIISLDGIENMKNLVRLEAYNCNLGKNEIYDKSLNNLGKNDLTDSLIALRELANLKILYLYNNYNLIWVDYLINLSNLQELSLSSNEKIANESFGNIKTLILRLGNNCRYPSKYGKLLDSSERQDLINEGLNNSSAEWVALYNNKKIKQLRLDNNINLEDEGTYSIQNVLKTCSSIEVLSLENINIVNIDFVKFMPNLKELDLVGTSVTNISALKDCTNLKTLVFDNEETDLTSIQSLISNMNIGLGNVKGSFFRDNISGIVGLNEKSLKSLENCTEITNLIVTCRALYETIAEANLDLTKCTSLSTIRLDSTKMNLKLPSNLQILAISWRASDSKFDVSDCIKLDSVSFYDGSQTALKYFASHLGNVKISEFILNRYRSFEGLINISPNCIIENFYSNMNGVTDKSAVIDYADNLANIPGLKKIGITEHGSFKGFSTDINFQDLQEIVIRDSDVIESLEFLKGSSKLKKVNVSKGKINSFKGITQLTELTDLKVTNNAISSVYEIKDLKNLSVLDLENNCIYDTTSYFNSLNEKVTVKNLEILANMNKDGSLRQLYLSGNTGITDWSQLSKITNWTGKSGW